MKNKIFFIILLFFILFFSYINISSAFTVDIEGTVYDVSDLELYEYNLFMINPYNSSTVILFSTVEPMKIGYGGRVELDGAYYRYHNTSNAGWVLNASASTASISLGSEYNPAIKASDYDIYYEEEYGGELFKEANIIKMDRFELNLSVEPSDYTINVPVVISSQYFTEEGMRKYDLEYSLDGDTWIYCDIRSLTDSSTGVTTYQYCYEAYKNESIYFRFLNTETGEYIYQSMTINNIVITQDNVNNYIDGVFKPTPFLGIEYISDTEIYITTQKFYLDEILLIDASYLKLEEDTDIDNEDNWIDMYIRSFTDSLSGQTVYQFYTSISNAEGTGDGTYSVRFYNKELDLYTYATAEVIFQNIIDYQDQLEQANSNFNMFVEFFKDRFGFLTYPFELIVDILKNINRIQFEEPKFSIPDVYEPTTNEKIISATEFNFNDLLKNDVLKNVHEIYLVVVDVIIIFGVVNFAKKKIMHVFDK